VANGIHWLLNAGLPMRAIAKVIGLSLQDIKRLVELLAAPSKREN